MKQEPVPMVQVSQFDGQDDLFKSVEDIVTEKLNELKEAKA